MPPPPCQDETADLKTDLANPPRWFVGRALAFTCAVPDQFRVLLLMEAVKIFWVGKHFRYLLGVRGSAVRKGRLRNQVRHPMRAGSV